MTAAGRLATIAIDGSRLISKNPAARALATKLIGQGFRVKIMCRRGSVTYDERK